MPSLVQTKEGWGDLPPDDEDRLRLEALVASTPGLYQVSWGARGDLEKLGEFLYPEGDYLLLARKRERLRTYLENRKDADRAGVSYADYLR